MSQISDLWAPQKAQLFDMFKSNQLATGLPKLATSSAIRGQQVFTHASILEKFIIWSGATVSPKKTKVSLPNSLIRLRRRKASFN
jgi:hypothetical protein